MKFNNICNKCTSSIITVTIFLISFVFGDPDLTLLKRKTNSEYTYNCVIGNKDVHLPVDFLTEPLRVRNKQESIYRTPEGETINDQYNCNFEYECWDNYITNNYWELSSDNQLLQITNDIRFEQLEIQTTKDSNYELEVENDFYFSFSLRADFEPYIIFCTESEPNNDKIQCYWICIEKENRRKKYVVAIRSCPFVNKETFPIGTSGCRNAIPMYPELKNDNIPNLDWFHFIAIRKGKTLTFNDGFTNENYFILNNATWDIKKIYLRTANEHRGEWKIHKNTYLKLKTFNSEVQLGPTFKNNNMGKFCISMFISICKGCSIEIRINNGEKQTYYSTSEIWKYIKLLNNNMNEKEHTVFIRGFKKNNLGIIAIDNIRLCHENEIRVLKTNSNYGMVCKSLNYSTWYTNNSPPNKSNEICEDPKYIGKNCDLPCSVVFENEVDFCNKNLICNPTENINEQNCVCASGYMGENCDEICNAGTFGYSCKNKCGKCKNNQVCLKSSGNCPYGCEDGFIPEKCLYKDCVSTSNENGLINITWTSNNKSIKSYKILVEKSHSEVANNFSMHEGVTIRSDMYIINYLPLSSSYKIKVCENNSDNCSACSLITPPAKPQLQEGFIFEEYIQGDTKVIRIPGIIASTKSMNSSMYITVCNETSENIYIQKMKFSEDNHVLSLITCAGTSWIAGKLNTNETEISFTVGEGKKPSNIYENPPLANIYSNKYNICAVVINEYKTLESFNVFIEFDDGYDPSVNFIVGVSVLGTLSGIIIIATLFFGIKYCISKNKNPPNDLPEAVPMNRNNVPETENAVSGDTSTL